MESIKEIIKSFERETYPSGVGSIHRGIESSDYGKLEARIKKHVLEQIMLDLYCDVKEIHSKQQVKDWVNQM